MSSLFWTPCACGEQRLPYGVNVILDVNHEPHRATICATQRITLNSNEPPAPTPPPWTGSVVCSHGERVWVTGPDPVAALAALGCGCPDDLSGFGAPVDVEASS